MRVVVGITGASGAVIGARALEELRRRGHEAIAVVSGPGRRVLELEMPGGRLDADAVYGPDDLDAPVASSTHPVDAAIVAPCSARTLAAIAHGLEDTLVVRAASCCLRNGRPVVLVPRETPLTLAFIENLRAAKLNGCSILPPCVAYYTRPKDVGEVTDFFVGRALDLVGVPNDLYRRWDGAEGTGASA